LLRALVVAGLQTLGLLTPRRDRVRVTLSGLAFTTTVRVIDRVHDDTANGRADALPTLSAGFAVLTQVVFAVADFADGGAAIGVNLAHFTRAQTQGGVGAFASNQLHRGAGAAREL